MWGIGRERPYVPSGRLVQEMGLENERETLRAREGRLHSFYKLGKLSLCLCYGQVRAGRKTQRCYFLVFVYIGNGMNVIEATVGN